MANNNATSEGEYCVPETEITSSRRIVEELTVMLHFEEMNNVQLKGMRVGQVLM
jgi:hypothetical protein